jgi:uncharacterized protein YbjT (DUF2867 family)
MSEGWAVRGTSRRQEGLVEIEAAGIEPALADPLRPATVLELVGDVALVVWLLGSAQGEAGAIAAIHGEKLERLLERLVETPVRRFAYEATGNVEREILARGAAAARAAGERWRIPIAVVEADSDDPAILAEAVLAMA